MTALLQFDGAPLVGRRYLDIATDAIVEIIS